MTIVEATSGIVSCEATKIWFLPLTILPFIHHNSGHRWSLRVLWLSSVITETSSTPFPRASGGVDVRCVTGCSWQGAISMAKKKKKAAKKVAKKKTTKKKGHG
jgi:hypothetical protein